MTNNDTKNRVLELFPDNNKYDISALDLRTFVEAVFNDREVKVIKISSSLDIPFNSSEIYEGSLVIIYRGISSDEVGIYLSTVNQPTNINQLIRISSPSTLNSLINVENAGEGDVLILRNGIWVAEDNLNNIQNKIELERLFKEAENNYFKELVYDIDGNISQINIYQDDTKSIKFFTKNISYNVDGNISLVEILDESTNNRLIKTLNYSGNDLINIYTSFTLA